MPVNASKVSVGSHIHSVGTTVCWWGKFTIKKLIHGATFGRLSVAGGFETFPRLIPFFMAQPLLLTVPSKQHICKCDKRNNLTSAGFSNTTAELSNKWHFVTIPKSFWTCCRFALFLGTVATHNDELKCPYLIPLMALHDNEKTSGRVYDMQLWW